MNQERKGKRILVLIPSEKKAGGQSFYWRALSKYLGGDIIYLERGRRGEGVLFRITAPFVLLYDYLCFFILCRGDISLVHINSTLNLPAMLRDSVFMAIAGRSGKKVLFSYHGWESRYERCLNKGHLYRRLVFKSRAVTVMSEHAAGLIKGLGYAGRIIKEQTFFDDDLVSDFSEGDINARFDRDFFQILFLSRIERSKGVFDAVDAFALIKKRRENAGLVIAGEGSSLSELKRYIMKRKYEGISLAGNVEGAQKKELFRNSDLFVLPTGRDAMPMALVEAMAFGLPVITCRTGGIADFFLQGEMGFMLADCSAENLAGFSERFINDNEMRKRVSLFNFWYARDNFYASSAGRRVKKLYGELMA